MAKHSTRPSATPMRAVPEVASLRLDQRERRQRIIDAAERLMFDADYEKIQVKDVADRADVALGTLYRYFNSKDHLFACALTSWSRGFGDDPEPIPSGPTTEDRVKAIYRRAARAFERQPKVYDVVMQIQSSKDPNAARVWREFAGQQSDAFGLALRGSRLAEEKQRDVTAVMSAVLDENLRSWQLGLQPIAAVYEAIDRAAALILGR
jgi:TetR/AcrR family transcriptional regulator, cholesterol catabolism regulator